MTSRDEERSADPAGEPADNPTDEELDVEGPNESAPGHEPSEGEDRSGGEPAPPASER